MLLKSSHEREPSTILKTHIFQRKHWFVKINKMQYNQSVYRYQLHYHSKHMGHEKVY